MNIKRLLSGIFLLGLTVGILALGNTTIVNITIAIVTLLALNEYLNSLKVKKKYERIFADLVAISIAFLDVIPYKFLILVYPITIIALFVEVITTEMKTNFLDIVKTGFGIIYIAGFLLFIPLLYKENNGKFLIWYIAIASWGTDTFAYWIGNKFGKHKLTPISPKKSVEGSFGGIVGAVIMALIYTYFINKYGNMNFSIHIVAGLTFILSILSQIGDLAASSIKRCVGIKDFSKLIPGHGGMLDRVDSILFIAPFAYFLLMII